MNEGYAVVGAGGHARVVFSLLRARGLPISGWFDDRADLPGGVLDGAPRLGSTRDLSAYAGLVVFALGNNGARRDLVALLGPMASVAEAIVHPAAWVDPLARLGSGTVVFAGAVVQVGACIGAHAIVNTGATVDHDCLLGDFSHVCPGAHLAGGVRLGEGAFIGTGAALIPRVAVGAWARVGAGSAVIADVAPGCTVVGVPARRSSTRDER